MFVLKNECICIRNDGHILTLIKYRKNKRHLKKQWKARKQIIRSRVFPSSGTLYIYINTYTFIDQTNLALPVASITSCAFIVSATRNISSLPMSNLVLPLRLSSMEQNKTARLDDFHTVEGLPPEL